MSDLERYYAKYDRMFYGDSLWDRMLASLEHPERLSIYSAKTGLYVNEAGNRIELKFQALSPQLLQNVNQPEYRRWLADEFLRRIMQEEMRQCPADSKQALREFQALIRQGGANRLVQTVYAMLRYCT